MTQIPHITNYQIVSEYETSQLGSKIEAAIHNGWQPFGPLTVANTVSDVGRTEIKYSQALVKHSEWYR